MLGLDWQRGFHKSITHQLHPAVTRGLIDRKRNMPRTEAGMASLFCVARRPSEPVDQEISKALFCTFEILRRVHGFSGGRLVESGYKTRPPDA